MWMQMQDWGWGIMGFGWLIMLLFWGMVIVGVVALIKWLIGASSDTRYRPLDILKERSHDFFPPRGITDMCTK